MTCLVCDEVSGTIDLPGGLLMADPHLVACHAPPAPGNETPYLGHLLVLPRRHVASWGDLSAEEAASVGPFIQQLTAALERHGATRVYLAVIGHHGQHLHVHLLPRYPDTPADVPWHAVDEWPGSRHGDAADVAALTNELRDQLQAG